MSSSISTDAVHSIVEKLKWEQHRSSTQKTYYSAWKSFNKFYVRLDTHSKNWEDRLTLFIAYMIKDEKKSTTIKSYISAIKAVLFELDEPMNKNTALLRALTKACRLQNDQVKARLPIRKPLLTSILRNLSDSFNSPQEYLTILYRALFTTAYFGLFRVGELTLGEHVVKVSDVHIGMNKNKLSFVLHTSKTHSKSNWPQQIKITGLNAKLTPNTATFRIHHEICPFMLLRNYIGVRNKRQSDQQQFFIFKDGSPVTPYHFRRTLKAVITHIGLNPDLYQTHSMRAGRSMDLLDMGLSVETIKKLGRWRSNAVFTYLR